VFDSAKKKSPGILYDTLFILDVLIQIDDLDVL